MGEKINFSKLYQMSSKYFYVLMPFIFLSRVFLKSKLQNFNYCYKYLFIYSIIVSYSVMMKNGSSLLFLVVPPVLKDPWRCPTSPPRAASCAGSLLQMTAVCPSRSMKLRCSVPKPRSGFVKER